jgi:hypothetical protein
VHRHRLARLVAVAAAAAGALTGGTAPAAAQGCANVAVRSPLGGDAVRGVVRVLGSARIDAFQFYKLEWAPAQAPESWSAVSDVRTEPVVNGLLDQWDTTRLPDGRYRLRLVVVDARADEVCRAIVDDLQVANRATPEAEATATAPEPAAAVPAATLIPSAPLPTSAGTRVRPAGATTATPTPTAPPATPTSEDAAASAVLAGRWIDGDAAAGALRAFVGGFAAVAAVTLAALAAWALRRRS